LVASIPIRRGGGLALRVGYEVALKIGADIVVSIDADGQHLPEELPVMIRADRRGRGGHGERLTVVRLLRAGEH
jgi:glycosyltransferase involved in cell wall biosynthesis